MSDRRVSHPHFGYGQLLRTMMGGLEWEVLFESGRRFRLPAREFADDNQPPRPTIKPLALRNTNGDSEQFRARQTLEALRVGIVPVQDAEMLTIGLEAERVTLQRAVERTRDGSGDVLAVIGDYGFGKSHFIELAAQRGLRENCLIASASLDLVEVPPSKAHKIYEALVTSLQYPDTNERGLAPLLRRALDKPSVVAALAAQCPREVLECPLVSALLALQECPSELAFEQTVYWLSGQSKPQTAMKTCFKRPPRLYLTGETARQYSYLLSGLSVLATLLGYQGLLVLIDESEHYSLLRGANRDRADSFFRAMIVTALGLNNGRIAAQDIPDNPRAEYPISFASEPHLLFLFTLTESDDRMPVGTWLAPTHIIRLDDRFIEKDIRKFLVNVLEYHILAYGYTALQPRYEQIVQNGATALYRALSQHRINLRELIRAVVTVCDLLFLHPDYTPETLLEELRHGLKV